MIKQITNLIENHKFIRRVCLGIWLWLFIDATKVVFTSEVLMNITGAGATVYGTFVGVSGLIVGYYFKSRKDESIEYAKCGSSEHDKHE